jgi:hypothetical protein
MEVEEAGGAEEVAEVERFDDGSTKGSSCISSLE